MVNDTVMQRGNIIIREELGKQTGDVRSQTADGRWWVTYNGQVVGTGDEVKTLWRPK